MMMIEHFIAIIDVIQAGFCLIIIDIEQRVNSNFYSMTLHSSY